MCAKESSHEEACVTITLSTLSDSAKAMRYSLRGMAIDPNSEITSLLGAPTKSGPFVVCVSHYSKMQGWIW